MDSDDGRDVRGWRWSLHLQDALARGDAERALDRADAEIAGARERIARKIEARGLGLRGRVLVFMGRREEAENSLRDALEIATRIEHPPVAWRALSLMGEVARQRGDTNLVDRYFGEVGALVESRLSSIDRSELRSEFRAMSERLIADPLAAYR